ncbi:MAG: sugar transferase [Flavobacterium sp.]|nr:MAG: sugar transferase [Flavobacterium sp.]
MYRSVIKRLIDLLGSLLLLVILSPIMLIIFIALKVTGNGNPIFTQERAGRWEIPFRLFKFKTMIELTTSTGQMASDELRLTTLGKFLRKTSLDELPQLINVLIGQMSLIGPRPLFIKYLSSYRGKEVKRHDVRPGISGWAQVNGRNNATWDERLSLDVYYVENISFGFDLKILYKTIINIILSKDVVVGNPYAMKDLNEERAFDISSGVEIKETNKA